MKNPPCSVCPGEDCTTCSRNPEYSTPVKLYTPKGAARALLVGKKLRGESGEIYVFENGSFCRRDKNGCLISIFTLSGLWEDI